LWTLSIVHNSKELESTTFRELDVFPSSGEGMEACILLGIWTSDLGQFFLMDATKQVSLSLFLSHHLKTETDPVSETLFSSI
jgi:hypothetical protein